MAVFRVTQPYLNLLVTWPPINVRGGGGGGGGREVQADMEETDGERLPRVEAHNS